MYMFYIFYNTLPPRFIPQQFVQHLFEHVKKLNERKCCLIPTLSNKGRGLTATAKGWMVFLSRFSLYLLLLLLLFLFVYFLLAPMTTPSSVAAARVGKPVRWGTCASTNTMTLPQCLVKKFSPPHW